MDHVHFFVSTSDNYQPVFQCYEKSFVECGLPASQLHVHRYTMPASGGHGFKTASWYHALTEKMRFFVHELPRLRSHEVGLFTDADVQFFDNPDAFHEVVKGMLDLDLDVVFMREHTKDEVNGGVFFARNTPAALALLQHGLTENENGTYALGEQDAFNCYLRKPSPDSKPRPLRWQYLDTSKVVWGPHLPRDWRHVIVHHAVCAKSMDRKVEQLQRVRREYHTWQKNRGI